MNLEVHSAHTSATISSLCSKSHSSTKDSDTVIYHHKDHIYKIESLVYRTADIQGMGTFGLILVPQPYNKLER
jgi:hypothetical protein